jgi:hypothetical protein
MSTINVTMECGCFKRSPFENGQSFESKDDALMKGQEMIQTMNTKFCGKHEFSLAEDGENFTISVNPRQQQSSGCCGGGHCS